MNPVNVDLYVKDELEFEVRSRGDKPQGDVASLRKQLRELIAVGKEASRFKLRDVAPEMELCQAKWEELREALQSAPSTSRATQRLRQRLQHLFIRLKNIEAQPGTSEIKTDVVSLKT